LLVAVTVSNLTKGGLVMHKRKSRMERELALVLSIERDMRRLMTKEYSGYVRRYIFLDDTLNEVRRQRMILEAAMNGDKGAQAARSERSEDVT